MGKKLNCNCENKVTGSKHNPDCIHHIVWLDSIGRQGTDAKGKPLPEIDHNDPQHKILIRWNEFEILCSFACTKEEISTYFGCSKSTLLRRVEDYYGITFEAIHKKLAVLTDISLRREQIRLANKGNTTMLIWLGKQRLGQAEKHRVGNIDEEAFVFDGLGEYDTSKLPAHIRKAKEELDKK